MRGEGCQLQFVMLLNLSLCLAAHVNVPHAAWRLGANSEEAVLCRWILQVDAEAALEMFMQMQPPMEPSLVIPVLSAQVLDCLATGAACWVCQLHARLVNHVLLPAQ